MRRRLAASFSLLLICLLLVQLVAAVIPQKALAAGKEYGIGQQINEFCSPEMSKYGSNGDRYQPDGWVSFRFINRATIEATYNNGHKCDKLVGATDFGPLFSGTDHLYVDKDTSDDNMRYTDQTNKDSTTDQSFINNFGDCTSKSGDNLGANDRKVSTQDINNSCLRNGSGGVELKLSIIESLVPGYNCVKSEGSDHFTFANVPSDNKPNVWRCDNNFSSGSGLVIVDRFSNTDNFNITYALVLGSGGSTIQNVSPSLQNTRNFSKCTQGTIDIYTNGPNCSGDLELLDKSGKPLIYGALDKLGVGTTDIQIASVADSSKTATVTVAGDKNESSLRVVSAQGVAKLGTSDQTPVCESSGFTLSWLFCPIINGLANASDAIFDKVIKPLLKVSSINPSDTTSPEYKMWSSFRIIANILLILALLVAVFGQTIGLDAYTAKKMVPRILVAAVMINLSIYAVSFAVDMTNIIGGGIGSILTAPLASAGSHVTYSLNGATSGIGLTVLFGSLFAIKAIGLANVLPFIGLFILLPAFLAFLGVVVTLLIRRGIILLLIISSPIAFVLYCLPNTEQYFKKWWDLLLKTLLVYPIVIIVFSMAQVLSVTINLAGKTGGISSVFAQLLGVILLIIPLFLIPFAFKFAGGVIGNFAGTLAGWNKRAHQGVLGDARNQNSARNRAKARFGSGATRAQARMVDPGRKKTASTRQRAVGRFADMFGDVDQRMSNYTRAETERREAKSATGRDALIYAGAGYQDDNGKYFNAKGDEIGVNEYRKGKQLHGSTPQQVATSLAYTLSKAQHDGHKKAFRTAFGKNAIAEQWNQDEANDAWASATYGQKGISATEWYSKPTIGTDSNGRTNQVTFNDVSDSQKHYREMLGDIHKSRQSFQINSDRDDDFRTLYHWQQQLEGRVANKSASSEDLNDLARTYEVFDAVSQRYQQGRTGQLDASGAPIGGVSAAGSTPASQPIIEGAVNNRIYGMTGINPSGDRNIMDGAQLIGTVNTAGDMGRTVAPRIIT